MTFLNVLFLVGCGSGPTRPLNDDEYRCCGQQSGLFSGPTGTYRIWGQRAPTQESLQNSLKP